MATSPRPAVRWAVPAGLAVVAVGASLVAPTIAAAEPDLPDVTAAELLADLRTEPVEGLSGTVVHRTDLGLPSLPGFTDGGGGGPVGRPADVLSLLDGEHTLRVWASAPDRARVSLHGGMSEMTVVTDGAEAWVWQSEGSSATRFLLPEHDAVDKAALREKALEHRARAGLPPMTPDQYAEMLLDAVDPSTEVTVGDPVTVAGRAAYELVLDPRADGTLVDEVRIAVDAADRVPTRVQVFAVGHDAPAVDVGFTELSLVPPADDVFAFSPPPGAEVEVVDLRDGPRRLTHEDLGEPGEGGELTAPDDSARGERPVTVVGEGWERVLVATLPPQALARLSGEQPADDGAPSGSEEGDAETFRPGPPPRDDEAPSFAGVLGALPRVEGDWGSGRLLESRLFSVLLADDGRVLVGAVDGDALQAAAAATAAG